jgi:uncharacterized repeat protein (TIGR01451 family)
MLLVAAGCGDDPEPVPGTCELQLTKEAVGGGTIGGPVTYELTIQNIGDADCQTPLTVTDSMPTGVTYDSTPSSNWGCSTTSTNPDEVECTYNGQPLADGDSLTLELEAQVGDEACMASNCAEVANTGTNPSKKARVDKTPENNRDCAETHCSNADNCIDPPSGMVGWWTADQTTDDRSGQNNHGVIQNGTHYSTGKVLEAFEFNGSIDSIVVGGTPSLNFGPTDQFSIDLWVNPDDGPDELDHILDKRAENADGTRTGYGLRLKGETLVVYTQKNATAATHSVSNAVPTNQWTHVTVTVDLDADTGIVYLDGVQASTFQPSTTGAGDIQNSRPLAIGRSSFGQHHFDGRLDEIEIFDRVLSASEVAGLADAGACGKCRLDCKEGDETYAGGEDDNFGGGPDQAGPSPFLQSITPNEGFDSPQRDRHFIHSFVGLKPTLEYRYICGAELEIRMRPSGGIDRNDTLQLNFSDGNGNQVGSQWTSYIGAPGNFGNWTDSLLSTTWQNSQGVGAQTFNLDLANLPQSGANPTNLMPSLNAHEMLNIRVQDDTEVDYANLTVTYSCEPCEFDQPPTDLHIRKMLKGELQVGQPASYVVSVLNTSNNDAAPTTTITDEVPACMNITNIPAPWDQWCSVNGQTVTCQYPDPIPAGTQTPDLVIEVEPTADCGDLAENCATVSNDADDNPDNDEACVETEVSHAEADLSIRKRALTSDGFPQGYNGTYELLVVNNGPDAAQGPITVTDTLPSCMTYVGTTASSWSCSASGNQVTCTHPGPLAAGQSESLDLQVSVTDKCGDLVENCASVEADSPTDPNSSNDETCIETEVYQPSSDLDIEKTHNGPITIAANNTYEITVHNNGPDTDPGSILVRDKLPECLRFVSGGPAPWSCTANNQLVTCTHPGPLQSGGNLDLQLEVYASGQCPDMLRNCARVNSSADSDSSNNEGCDMSNMQN